MEQGRRHGDGGGGDPGGEGPTGLSTVLVRLCSGPLCRGGAWFHPGACADAGRRLWAGASGSPPGAWCDVSAGAPEAEEETDNSHLWGVPSALPTPRHTVGKEMLVSVCACLWGSRGGGGGDAQRGAHRAQGTSFKLDLHSQSSSTLFLKIILLKCVSKLVVQFLLLASECTLPRSPK